MLCQKAKHSTSMDLLPVLACQFFKITIYTLRKTPFFRTVDLTLIVKPDIIVIVMDIDKISFFN